MLILGEHPLKIDELLKVARGDEIVKIGENANAQIDLSHRRLIQLVESDHPVYGINTGYGVFSDKKINKRDLKKLNRNLILSHAVGTGTPLTDEIVRATMLVRANTLAKGFSGVRVDLIQTIIDALNKKVVPEIPDQGSLGSSGDLSPLSHMALVLTTDEKNLDSESGFAWYKGKRYTGKKAMELAGIERIILGPKEGLALNNGATFSASITAQVIYEAKYLLEIAEKALGMTLEALRGSPDAFDPRIHKARGLDGQIESAERVLQNIEGSTLVGSTNRVQDAYSLRCAPQVHGAVRDTVNFAANIIEREINAATDNPLIFDPAVAISGGNFHGEPIGLVADYLGIALCELGAISERRTFRLTDGKLNDGLPSMLVDSADGEGLNSGVMILQYTAASLVMENQTLATPDSVHSLPTSGGQEDHNANAMTAARHALMIVNNTRQVIAIELYVAARAIDLRLRMNNGKLGEINQDTYDKIRVRVPFHSEDTLWGKEVEKVHEMLMEHLI